MNPDLMGAATGGALRFAACGSTARSTTDQENAVTSTAEYGRDRVITRGVNRRASIAEELLLPVVEQLRVMGQVVRLRLIECLAKGDATPHELADELGLSQQNVSKHLQILYRAGLVQRRRDGTTVLYSLADAETVVILDEIVARVSAQIAELSRLASPDRHGRDSDDAGRTRGD